MTETHFQFVEALVNLWECLTFAIYVYFIAFVSIVKQLYRRSKDTKHFQKLQPTFAQGRLGTSRYCAVVTGGGSGIGKECCRLLAERGYHVIIGCKENKEGTDTVTHIQKLHSGAKVEYFLLDLSNKRSIEEFVSRISQADVNLHLLVNNAGVMMCPYKTTPDGFEEHLGVNFLGHLYLTKLLLPLLEKSGAVESFSRIINVSSVVHEIGYIDLNKLNQTRLEYCSYSAYVQSKVAVVLGTYKLNRLLMSRGCRVSAIAVNPGVVHTNLYRHINPVIRGLMDAFAVLLKTPAEGSFSVVYAALASDLEGRGGVYISDLRETPSHACTHDRALQDQLWRLSSELLDIRW